MAYQDRSLPSRSSTTGWLPLRNSLPQNERLLSPAFKVPAYFTSAPAHGHRRMRVRMQTVSGVTVGDLSRNGLLEITTIHKYTSARLTPRGVWFAQAVANHLGTNVADTIDVEVSKTV